MKTLHVFLALVLLSGMAFGQQRVWKTWESAEVISNTAGLTDKATGLTYDSSSWRPLAWDVGSTFMSVFPDSMKIFSWGYQTNDSVATYVAVDFAGSDPTKFYRVTVDSIKARTAIAGTKQFQMWSIASLTGLPGFKNGFWGFTQWRVVLVPALTPEPTAAKPYILAGNSTGAGTFKEQVKVRVAFVGTAVRR